MRLDKTSIRKIREKVLTEVRKVEARTAKTSGLQIARNLSSGPFKSKALAKMDHPDARRHGSPGFPFGTGAINEQSGILKASWRMKDVPAGAAPVIENIASYAKYLDVNNPEYPGGGTGKMFGIPIQDYILIYLNPIREANVRAMNGEINL